MGMQKPEYSDVRGFIPTTEQRPFQPILVTPDDLLLATVRNSLAGQSLVLSGRLWLLNGQENEFSHPIVPGTARALQTFSFQLHYGWLPYVAVTAAGPVTRRGMTLVSLKIARAPVIGGFTKWFLAQDYVTSTNAVGWPPGRIMEGVESAGNIAGISVANPAAGADWNTTVPIPARWRIRSVFATLATSAVVATRIPRLSVAGGLGGSHIFPPTATQAAGLTVNYTGAALGAATADAANSQWLLPPDLQVNSFPVANFAVIAVTTAGLQAADQWSGITLLIEEWLED